MRVDVDVRSVREWTLLLEALVQISTEQRRRRVVPALSGAPQVRYRREPRGRERWQTARETFERGHGDCEDLAVWLVSDARVRGIPSRVVVRSSGPGKYHALAWIGGKVVDPSKARGMGRRQR